MTFKRLAIFSDCVHYYDESGHVVTQNHIFCRQMQALGDLFESVVMYCPFGEYKKGMVASGYKINSISFYSLPGVGGDGLKNKMKIIMAFPAWLKAYRKAAREADIIYQRFPNNLNIPGFFYFYFKKLKVFGTYTGTWDNYPNEPLTYRFQKWLLKKYFRGPVGIYSKQQFSTGRLFKSFSPSYTRDEWMQEHEHVSTKINALQNCRKHVPVFVTAGALVKNKNQQYILDVFLQLHREGFDFKLYIAGDGILRPAYGSFIRFNGLSDKVFLTGTLDALQMKALYRGADFVIQASLIEGFGKVPLEGFFYGVLPLLHDVSLAGEITGKSERGFLYKADQTEEAAGLIKKICQDQKKLAQMIENGRQYAKQYTMEHWVNDYSKKINDWFE